MDIRNVVLGVCVLAAGTAGVVVTAESRVPSELPDVALGSVAVLHFLRAAAVFVIILLSLAVLDRAIVSGQLPSEFSGQGLGYAEQARDEAATGLEAVIAKVKELDDRVRNIE
jgi:hypothetical protein